MRIYTHSECWTNFNRGGSSIPDPSHFIDVDGVVFQFADAIMDKRRNFFKAWLSPMLNEQIPAEGPPAGVNELNGSPTIGLGA